MVSMKRASSTYTRRGVLTGLGAVGLAGLAAPAAAQPPKRVLTAGPKGGDALRRIDGMEATIGRIQGRIADELDLDIGDGDVIADPGDEFYPGDSVLGTVLGHSFARTNSVRQARAAFLEGDREGTLANLGEVRTIVEGDIEVLEGVEERGGVGDVLGLERALLNQTESTIDAVERVGVMPGDNVT